MGVKNEYQNIFAFLREKISDGMRLDFYSDDLKEDYYLTGNMFGNKFGIEVKDENEISFVYYGKTRKYEQNILDALSEYKGDTPNVDYEIRDLIDKNVDIKVYEWNCDIKRYNMIQNSEIVSHPRYIVNPRITFKYDKEKSLKKELAGKL